MKVRGKNKMEVAYSYIIGIIMGTALGISWAKRKKLEEQIEISATGGIIDTLEKFMEAAEIMRQTHESLLPLKFDRKEVKNTTMTQQELFDKYLSLSERCNYVNGPGEQKRQELLEKAEKILDSVGCKFQPVVKIAVNSSNKSMDKK